MTKAILLSDLHLHHTPLWRLEWNTSFLKRLVDKYAKTHELFILGDAFESKDRIDCRVLNQFLYLVGEWECAVYWLTGQHDSYQPGIASLDGLRYLGINIIDRAVVQHPESPIYFVPYARELQDYRSFLAEVPPGSYVMTHIPTEEALFNQGVEIEVISIEEFRHFKKTFSGDIHTYVDFPSVNFSYVGTPSQRDWRDKSVKGAYGLFELHEDGDHTFKRLLTRHPMHVEVTSEDQELPPDRKVIIKKAPNVHVESDNIIESVIKYTPADRPALSGSHDQNVSQLLSGYVKQQDPRDNPYGVDRDSVLKKGQQLYEQR